MRNKIGVGAVALIVVLAGAVAAEKPSEKYMEALNKVDKAQHSGGMRLGPNPEAIRRKVFAPKPLDSGPVNTAKDVDIDSLECPELLQPENVGFLVINLDRSVNRLQRMRDQFDQHNVPQFTRVPGVEYNPDKLYPVKRNSPHLKPADYGTAMAHYMAWKAAYNSKHRWNVIIEDDAELVEGIPYRGPWPKVPKDADLVLLRHSTVFETQPICNETPVLRTTWGFGMVAYLVNRAGARRLMKAAAETGFSAPIDGFIWYHSKVCTMAEDWISHAPCGSPCKDSIRTYLNGEIDEEPD